MSRIMLELPDVRQHSRRVNRDKKFDLWLQTMGNRFDASRTIADLGGEGDEVFPWLAGRVMVVLGVVGRVLVLVGSAAADGARDCAV